MHHSCHVAWICQFGAIKKIEDGQDVVLKDFRHEVINIIQNHSVVVINLLVGGSPA